MDVTIHSLALLAARGARAQPRDGRVILHLEEAEAELAVARDGRLILSRAFPLPQDAKERGHALAEELRRSLGTLRVEDRERVADVLVTGGEGLPGTRWTELPVGSEIPLPDRLRGVPDDSSFVPALAVALRRPLRGALPTNLMPDELRPRPFPWPVAVAATLAALTLLLALTIPALTLIRDERRLRALDRALAELAPEVRDVEKLASAVERARREAETLRSFQAQHVRALPLLRELIELLPQDVWLTNFSVDKKGIELAGFANSASQLIPLLEASPTLERVEFISPVTKGRDREQFRLKAGWERPPGRPPTQSGAPPRAEASREPAPPSSTGAPRPAPLPGSR